MWLNPHHQKTCLQIAQISLYRQVPRVIVSKTGNLNFEKSQFTWFITESIRSPDRYVKSLLEVGLSKPNFH